MSYFTFCEEQNIIGVSMVNYYCLLTKIFSYPIASIYEEQNELKNDFKRKYASLMILNMRCHFYALRL